MNQTITEIAERVLRLVEDDAERCLQGCGEMGSCHANVSADARQLAEYILSHVCVGVKP